MYKAAVIGLGKIGLQFDIPRKETPQSHVLAYHLHPGIELVAAVGVRDEQGEKLAGVAPEARFYTDLEEMLSHHRPDIVSICTPTHVRYEVLRTVLEKSETKVIFLEKPVAGELPEALSIRELMDRHPGRQLLVNLSRRWSSGAAQIRQAVRSKRYGELRKVHLRYTRGIYNTGSHLFDLVGFTAGAIDSVAVVNRVSTTLDDKEDWTYSFLFKMNGGIVTGYAEAFDDRDYLLFEMELFFERGRIELLKGGGEVRYSATEDHPLMSGYKQLRADRAPDVSSASSSNIVNAVEHLTKVIEGVEPPVSTLDDGLYPMFVAEALQASYRSGGAFVEVKR